MRRIPRIAYLALALLAAGCGERASELLPASPTAPAGPLSTVAAATMTIRGSILDTAFQPLPGARLEVLNGDSAGIVTVANEYGSVELTGVFSKDTLFRATADLHDPRTQSWTCAIGAACSAGGANPYFAFRLNPLEAPVDIAGTYTLTIVADAACVDIPPDLRVRMYRATVSAQPLDGRPVPAAFDLNVEDNSMIGLYRGFTIGVAGTRLGLWLHGGHDPVIVERLNANESISVSGLADTTVSGSRPSVITAALDGWIEYSSPRGATFNCTSTAHQIILKRL